MEREYPTMKGFNRAGIYRMKQFYETYKDNEIVAPLVRQISWTHNVMILGATNSIEEKEFYIKMCIKNNYSKRELDRQIASGYFHRYMLSNGKANQSLVKATGEEDYPNTRILDMYSLEFLDLPNQFSEACCEVDFILDNLNPEDRMKIPETAIKFFKDNKSLFYKVNLTASKPLSQQKLKDETKAFLQIINFTYFADKQQKREFLELFAKEEKNDIIKEQVKDNSTELVIYKENKILTFFKNILDFFRRNKK